MWNVRTRLIPVERVSWPDNYYDSIILLLSVSDHD